MSLYLQGRDGQAGERGPQGDVGEPVSCSDETVIAVTLQWLGCMNACF